MKEFIINQINSYEEYYGGFSFNQEILTEISLKHGLFKGKDVESILNIFLFEKIKDKKAYLRDSNLLNKSYLILNPQLVEQLINDNYSYY